MQSSKCSGIILTSHQCVVYRQIIGMAHLLSNPRLSLLTLYIGINIIIAAQSAGQAIYIFTDLQWSIDHGPFHSITRSSYIHNHRPPVVIELYRPWAISLYNC